MECKLQSVVNVLRAVIELIETLWNVNNMTLHFILTCNPELIETLWNVNLNENTKQMTELIELIETLWNVNTGLLVWFYRRNRN